MSSSVTATKWEMGRKHHLLSTSYAPSTGLDPFLILSLILTLILGDRPHHAQFTDEKTEDRRDEYIVLDPTAELGFKGRSAY